MAELAIDPEQICEFAARLRSVAGREPRASASDPTSGDDSIMARILEEEDDATLPELKDFIAAQSRQGQATLLVLLWLGRGDYAVEELGEAATEAYALLDRGDADFELDGELTPSHIEAGLDALGFSCEA